MNYSEYSECNSSHFIKELPSIFCCNCGTLQCNICNNNYIKCESCKEFCCNICSIKLLCDHTYCSIDCVLKNDNKICTHNCFFLRDVNSTGSDDYGLKNLLKYWYNIVEKDTINTWIEEWISDHSNKFFHYEVKNEKAPSIELDYEKNDINDKILKLKYLL